MNSREGGKADSMKKRSCSVKVPSAGASMATTPRTPQRRGVKPISLEILTEIGNDSNVQMLVRKMDMLCIEPNS